jgi:rubrerythrin
VVTEGRDGPSRRGLLGGAGVALAAAASVALDACGSSSSSASTTSASSRAAGHRPGSSTSPHDVRLLSSALELERRTVDAYAACVPLLDHHAAKGATQWLAEELQHTGKLITLIRQAGGTAAPRANSYDIGSQPHGQTQTLRLLEGFEQLQLDLYLKILPRIEQGAIRAAVASIFASDAQHLSMLRLLDGRTPVPSAFVA